jgi:N-acetylglucosaminyl-diphospho-decaprenol L-rhamnosyltransferase
MTPQATIYVPNLDGAARLGALLVSLREQTRPARVTIVDNGSGDGSQELLHADFPEVELLELGENLGFGPALNRAVAAGPGDPVILLNNDVVCEPRFLEALLEPAAAGAEMVAGVLLTERDPGFVDSAGVIADRTLMGFDYLKG